MACGVFSKVAGWVISKTHHCECSVNCCGTVYEAGKGSSLSLGDRVGICWQTGQGCLCGIYQFTRNCGDCLTCGMLCVCCEPRGTCVQRTQRAAQSCGLCVCGVKDCAVQVMTCCQYRSGDAPVIQRMELMEIKTE